MHPIVAGLKINVADNTILGVIMPALGCSTAQCVDTTMIQNVRMDCPTVVNATTWLTCDPNGFIETMYASIVGVFYFCFTYILLQKS